jgi:uncharacterized protein
MAFGSAVAACAKVVLGLDDRELMLGLERARHARGRELRVAPERAERRALAAYFEADLVDAVLARSTGARSRLHGVSHWTRVIEHGRALAGRTPGADATTVTLFGLFHDAMRDHDGEDPRHGARGAALAGELLPRLRPHGGLTGSQWRKLATACREHTAGLVTYDPTIGCAWDADRLDLQRFGVAPDPRLLSTAAARRAVEAARPEELSSFTGWRVSLVARYADGSLRLQSPCVPAFGWPTDRPAEATCTAGHKPPHPGCCGICAAATPEECTGIYDTTGLARGMPCELLESDSPIAATLIENLTRFALPEGAECVTRALCADELSGRVLHCVYGSYVDWRGSHARVLKLYVPPDEPPALGAAAAAEVAAGLASAYRVPVYVAPFRTVAVRPRRSAA